MLPVRFYGDLLSFGVWFWLSVRGREISIALGVRMWEVILILVDGLMLGEGGSEGGLSEHSNNNEWEVQK